MSRTNREGKEILSGHNRNLFGVRTQTNNRGKSVFVKYPKVQLLVIAHVVHSFQIFSPYPRTCSVYQCILHQSAIPKNAK